jgi:hypothetical protein
MYPIRPWLYIGKYSETANTALLYEHKIGAMLQLAAPINQPKIERLYLAVDDGVALPAEMIKRGVAFIREQKAAGKVVLSACGAGISRSTTFAIAALHEEEQLDLYAAFADICDQHPTAMPHFELWQSLCNYYGIEPPIVLKIVERLDEIRRKHTP